MKRSLLLCCLIVTLAGCNESRNESGVSTPLQLADVLGGGADTAGFKRALEPRTFRFPRDYAMHPAYRNEWWYLTGNLEDDNGRRYGYQVTFFRNALAPPERDETHPSAWASRQIWMAHAAVTDIDGRRHEAVERFSRAEPGLAGAQLDPLRVWLDDWRLSGNGNDFPWRLKIDNETFSLQLTLDSEKPPVLHGDNGLSQKGGEPGEASYYYSLTRLNTRGRIRIGDRTLNVEGSSWLDREWSTGALAGSHTGWDWFSLQFDDGTELMYYRLRDRNGNTHPNSGGSLIEKDGTRRPIRPQDVELTPLDYWSSDTGQRYPVRWRLRYVPQNTTWLIEAAVDDQLMDLSFDYWEGAVEIRSADSRALVGRSYLEMVRD